MNKHIAVLITCHNRKQKTISCLSALYSCYIPENYIIEIFLVDDGSTDGTSNVIKQLFPKVNVIYGNGNLFWNRGMILAWTSAVKKKNYDYFLWLNDDTTLYIGSLSKIIKRAEETNLKEIIVGATCSAFDKNSLTYGGFNNLGMKIKPNGTWQDCHFFNGNIVFIPSVIFQQVGMLDNRFHHSLGDIDYGLRAKKMGFTNVLSLDYLGTCELHESDPIWMNPRFSLWKRLKHFYSPIGNNPFEAFIFERRHSGLFLALVRFLSNHLRVLFPSFWK